MVSKTLYINKPSKKLLELVRNIRQQKEAERKKIASMEDVYFPKKQ